MRLGNLSAVHPSVRSAVYRGHAHFWERAFSTALSRRQFLGATAAGAGAIAGSGLLSPMLAAAKGGSAAPRPIDYGFQIPGTGITFHASGLDASSELGVITDFTGSVGAADVQGNGTGFQPGHKPERLLFDSDMRFMQGRYVGQDGETHDGTFAFI
jgi:hypothetical protein